MHAQTEQHAPAPPPRPSPPVRPFRLPQKRRTLFENEGSRRAALHACRRFLPPPPGRAGPPCSITLNVCFARSAWACRHSLR
eukprot:1061198-Pleurochrysis_carterae.AAC.1